VFDTGYDVGAPYRLQVVDAGNPLTVFGLGTTGDCDTLTKSTDGGRSWQTSYSDCGDSASSNTILAVALDPFSPGTLLISDTSFMAHGGPSGSYLARSDDDGATWSDVSSNALAPLVFSPTEPGLLYGMSCDQLFASRDVGRTWHPLAAGLPCSGFPL